MTHIITAQDLDAFDHYCDQYPIAIDPVYARADHPENVFETQIYKSDCKIWAHRDMLQLTLRAAEICYETYGYILQIKDCLRPIEAQEALRQTPPVIQNPQWLQEPNRMLSSPGQGGHPRGMAIDLVLMDEHGGKPDMGTSFDAFPEDKHAPNPAARDYPHSDHIMQNRAKLNHVMQMAADEIGVALLPLPQEWWDFRFPRDVTAQYAPISDHDLPPDMQICLDQSTPL